MSDPVLRCPNCGTTQAAPGECDTCHEADVRWFCPNHTPGLWLDGPVCAECAARPKRATPPRPRATTPPPRDLSRGAPAPEPPPRRDLERELLDALLGGGRRDPSEPAYRGEVDAPAGWRVEPPVARRSEAPVPWGRDDAPGVRLPRLPFLGCIGKLIKLAIILIVLFGLATCWFFSGSGIIIGDAGAQPAIHLASATELVEAIRSRAAA